MITLSVSISAVTAQVLAQAALRYHAGRPQPGLLSDDRAPAIECLIRAAAAMVCTAMMPEIIGCPDFETSPGDSGSDLMQFELRDTCGANPVALRLLTEHALYAHTLAEIYAGTDEEASATFAADFNAALRKISDAVRRPCTTTRFRPFP